ncbi:MAG: GIY-YIG nuclease family protein [Cytophagales bacterium]|nr:GIY-YIG nuclease family protein [Rhizobacter sp.]
MSTAWVYEVLDAEGECLYVGCSSNVAARMSQHASTGSPWVPLKAKVIEHGPWERAEALAIEATMIFEQQPRFNSAHRNGSTYRERGRVEPPSVPLSALRRAARLTAEQVCANFKMMTGQTLSTGALSHIEGGTRAATSSVLRGLELAYGLREGSISTTYETRTRKAA